jgi:hypothetical protein
VASRQQQEKAVKLIRELPADGRMDYFISTETGLGKAYIEALRKRILGLNEGEVEGW